MARAVLVVHSDERLRRVVRVRLEHQGMTVAEATDVEQLVESIASSPIGAIIVVCGSRASGTSAQTLLAAARRADPSARMFFLASHTPFPPNSLSPGVEVFTKPDGLNVLCWAVKTAIDRGGQDRRGSASCECPPDGRAAP
jgi:DNA-binding NtrC family response regulator